MRKLLLLCLTTYLYLFSHNAAYADGIAVISRADITPYRLAITGFREQVKQPLYEYYPGMKKGDEVKVKAAIRQQKPELIFALGKSALHFSRELDAGVPVIFAFVLNPGAMQQHESGIAMMIAADRDLNVLLKIDPTVKEIGVIYDPVKSAGIIRQVRRAAEKRGVRLLEKPVTDRATSAQAVEVIMPKVDAVWMIPDTTVLNSTVLKQMIRLSLKESVALIALAPKHVRAGSLFSLSFDSRAVGMQAGGMVKKILRGKEMSQFVSPDVDMLTVNISTAERIGVDIPASLLKRAAHIYPQREAGR